MKLSLGKPTPTAPSLEVDWGAVGCLGGLGLFVLIVGVLITINRAAEKRRDGIRKAEATERAAAEQARAWAWQAQEAARVNAWNAEINRRAEQTRQETHQRLTARFGATAAVRIMKLEIWQGQTADMLHESRGQPHEIDERVMKTKTRHVYKYGWLSGNRYSLRVTLEDGVVVGWDDKA